MSQPMTPAAVHKQYDEAVTAFRRQISCPSFTLWIRFRAV